MRIPLPARPLLALALLLAALAALLCRPAGSPAKVVKSACSASAGANHVRACAGRAHPGRSHVKAKSHRSRRHRQLTKKARRTQDRAGAPAAAAAPTPAACEDGSRPRGEGGDTFSCGDGSEPSCASGAEPVVSSSGAKLVCPAAAASAAEWSEAECADDSEPESSPAGDWTCEDGSFPACPAGTAMKPSRDGSTLLCMPHGASSSGEEDEGESEGDASSARAETAS